MSVTLLDDISKGVCLKENLLALKESLKDEKEGNRQASLLVHVKNYIPVLVSLLENEDPKIRKNAALCLGYAEEQSALQPLFNAYMTDDIRYNKGTYLKAIAALDHSLIDEELSKRHAFLQNSVHDKENEKHVLEEMRELNKLLSDRSRHTFTGYSLVNEFVLLTNRNFENITEDKLGPVPHKEFTAGVMVKTKNLKKVLPIRTYEELLFIPDGMKTCPFEADACAEELINSNIVNFISERHDDNGKPFRFRVELRCKDASVKAGFEKNCAGALELKSSWKLVNSTSDYELEFRFVETSDGKLNVLVRFFTIPDDRFSYRKHTVSAGMKSSAAALICELCSKHFINNASVLDPFMGAGTLLVERNIIEPFRIAYGIDIFGEAVKKASVNIRAAGIASKCELINKNFFDFRHEYRFNEVLTEMPYITDRKTKNDIDILYSDFFKKIPELLEHENRLFIVTRNRELLRKHALKSRFTILEEYEISKREEMYLFVLTF